MLNFIQEDRLIFRLFELETSRFSTFVNNDLRRRHWHCEIHRPGQGAPHLIEVPVQADGAVPADLAPRLEQKQVFEVCTGIAGAAGLGQPVLG